MKYLRAKYRIALGVAVAVLLAGIVGAVLLMGRDAPDTPPPPVTETDGQTAETAPNGYELIATIEDDTLALGEEWDIDLKVLQNGEEVSKYHEIVASLEYAGDAMSVFSMSVRAAVSSSNLPLSAVPYSALLGSYDLVVTCAELYGVTEPPAEWRLESFLTVVPPPYEDYTVKATLSPNILNPGEFLNPKLDITVSCGQVRIMGGWTAELRLVGGEEAYSFSVCDEQTRWDLVTSSSLVFQPEPIPEDAPEGFYDLVVSMEEYGYEWVFSKIMLVWPEGKSLFEGMPAYEDFACTAEITDDSVIHGDIPEIRVGLTCKGEEYRDFEAWLTMIEYDVTIPLTYDTEKQRYLFPVDLDTPSLTYTLVVRDTQYDYTWYFPGFVTVEYWIKTQTVTEENGLSLRVAIRDDTLSRGEEWEILVDLRNPDGFINVSSVRLRSAEVSGAVYEMIVQEPGNWQLVTYRVDAAAPVGRYDLVVEMIPAVWWPDELDYEYHMWVIEDFMTVIDEAVTLG